MGIQKLTGGTVTYTQGCDVKCTDTSKFGDAINAAKGADVVVMVIGLDEGQERLDWIINISYYFINAFVGGH